MKNKILIHFSATILSLSVVPNLTAFSRDFRLMKSLEHEFKTKEHLREDRQHMKRVKCRIREKEEELRRCEHKMNEEIVRQKFYLFSIFVKFYENIRMIADCKTGEARGRYEGGGLMSYYIYFLQAVSS